MTFYQKFNDKKSSLCSNFFDTYFYEENDSNLKEYKTKNFSFKIKFKRKKKIVKYRLIVKLELIILKLGKVVCTKFNY